MRRKVEEGNFRWQMDLSWIYDHYAYDGNVKKQDQWEKLGRIR